MSIIIEKDDELSDNVISRSMMLMVPDFYDMATNDALTCVLQHAMA
jgi:hypothetical protein